MRASAIAIGIGVAGLIGFGVWLGRSSSTQTLPDLASAAPPEPTVPAPSKTTHARVAAGSPTLAARFTPPSPGLAADLVATDPKIRRAAVREVARSSDVDPAVLLSASRDPDLEVGAIATEALGKLYADGRVPLAEMVARATDHALNERVRVSALDGLGLVENPDAAKVLVELLARGDVTERRSAAILLMHQALEVAVPALIGALGDADEYVRSNAVEALRSRSRGRDFGSDAAAWRAWWQARPR
jgi:hypothetical protein